MPVEKKREQGLEAARHIWVRCCKALVRRNAHAVVEGAEEVVAVDRSVASARAEAAEHH